MQVLLSLAQTMMTVRPNGLPLLRQALSYMPQSKPPQNEEPSEVNKSPLADVPDGLSALFPKKTYPHLKRENYFWPSN